MSDLSTSLVPQSKPKEYTISSDLTEQLNFRLELIKKYAKEFKDIVYQRKALSEYQKLQNTIEYFSAEIIDGTIFIAEIRLSGKVFPPLVQKKITIFSEMLFELRNSINMFTNAYFRTR